MRSDYKAVSLRQRRQSVRRHGLLVITLVVVGLFGGLLAYIKGGAEARTVATLPPVASTPSIAPVVPSTPAVTASEAVAHDPAKPKYDFYTELPKRQVGIQ